MHGWWANVHSHRPPHPWSPPRRIRRGLILILHSSWRPATVAVDSLSLPTLYSLTHQEKSTSDSIEVGGGGGVQAGKLLNEWLHALHAKRSWNAMEAWGLNENKMKGGKRGRRRINNFTAHSRNACCKLKAFPLHYWLPNSHFCNWKRIMLPRAWLILDYSGTKLLWITRQILDLCFGWFLCIGINSRFFRCSGVFATGNNVKYQCQDQV